MVEGGWSTSGQADSLTSCQQLKVVVSYGWQYRRDIAGVPTNKVIRSRPKTMLVARQDQLVNESAWPEVPDRGLSR